MRHLIYRNSDTKIINHPQSGTAIYSTEKAARAALTRMLNKDQLLGNREDYSISDTRTYYDSIERMVTVKNLMSGKEVTQSVNTPLSCDPSSETYWSM